MLRTLARWSRAGVLVWLALIVLPACSGSSRSSPLDARPYTNDQVGFAIDLPAEWPPAYLKTDNDPGILVQISRGDFVGDPNGVLQGMSVRATNLSVEGATGPVRGRLSHLDDEYAQIAGDLGGALSERETAVVGGLPARRYTIDYPNGAEQIVLEILVTQTRDNQFELSCEAPAEQWGTISGLCQQSFSTFKLEGREATAQVPTVTDTATPYAGTATPAVATVLAATPTRRCGSDVSLTVAGESPIGRSYHDGDQLSLSLRYHAPGCKQLVAIFNGFHVVGSPWYEYWCISPGKLLTACTEDRVNSTLIDDGTDNIQLPGDDGEVTVTTKGGSFPPAALDSEPPLDGFTLCNVSVTLDDGIDQGGGGDARMQLGGGCP